MFGIGGSKASSSSQSQSTSFSSSFDNLDSFGFGVSQDQSTSGGVSTSRDASRTTSRVAFEDIFSQLYGGAFKAAGLVNTGALTDASNVLFGSGIGFLDTLGGGGGSELTDRLASNDELTQEQIDLLGSDIGKFLSETANPAITARGVQANTLGGSRGEVQRGLATEAALNEFARGSTQIRLAGRDRGDALARDIVQNRLAGATQGLGGLELLMGLKEAASLEALQPYLALSSIIGGPSVLTDSVSSGFSDSSQFAQSSGTSIDLNKSTGRAGSQSESQSTSSSKSKSASFSLGF